ncbi:YecA family protein [Bulleidia sp. HCP3S3_G12]|uniref:YecA family protein n=1 Tax=Bulleidia sp. HCP3S3_G12 TaxID=3438916 RepID=UPI003F896C40
MIVSKVAICPICGKRTLIRIQDGSYLNEYPIRINCMNCKTLIKGIYSMNKGNSGLKLINASITDPEIVIKETVDNRNDSLESFNFKNVDYVSEISGELPCKCTYEYKGGYPISPFLESIEKLSSMPDRIERLKDFLPNMEKWEKRKSIAFQLLSEGSIEYISIALNNKMGNYYYECDSYIKSLQCLQEVVVEESKYLFINPSIDNYISTVIHDLSTLDKTMLHEFVHEIGGIESLLYSYRKTIDVFSNFMNIYQYLLPAETYMYFNDEDEVFRCLSTCTFSDIKTFYQDSYESLSSLLFIPVSFDNINLRSDFNSFNKNFENVKCNKSRNLSWYRSLDNGTRINKICPDETFQKLLDLPAKVSLRNGIGHNNIKYDAVNQIIIAYDFKKNYVKFQNTLMNVAIDCLYLVKSAIVLSEMILFLMREEYRKEGIVSIIHPRFYEKALAYDDCPCGSGLKYKRCCMNQIKKTISMKNNSLYTRKH